MPELPEVETVRLSLSNHFLKCKIVKIRIFNRKLRYNISSNLLEFTNKKITSILRKGKYLILTFDFEKSILIHLGMTGVFKIKDSFKKTKHDHFSFYFQKKILTYNDVRKFGFVKIYQNDDLFSSKHLKILGPDPFEKKFNLKYLNNILKLRNVNIKSFLMNQKNICGLGNIYCSEVLFDCNISPKRYVINIKKEEIKNLYSSIKKILKKAIANGGTSLNDYLKPDGKLGYFKNELKVYGREKKKCVRCNSKNQIKKIFQNGRSTFYCNSCQK